MVEEKVKEGKSSNTVVELSSFDSEGIEDLDSESSSLYLLSLIRETSNSSGIPYYQVKEVVDAYNDYIYETVMSGQYSYVDYLGLSRFKLTKLNEAEEGIEVESSLSLLGKFSPLGYQFSIISGVTGYSLEVVQAILLRFVEVIKNELLSNNTVVVYGIIKFSLSISGRVRCKSSSKFSKLGANGYNFKVRSSVSPYWQYEFKKFASKTN